MARCATSGSTSSMNVIETAIPKELITEPRDTGNAPEAKRIQLQKHGDERGMLVALEENKNVPFVIRRVYYLLETKSEVHRGLHAHRNLKQLAVAVSGSMRFRLDNGFERMDVLLNNPALGLFLDRMIWREMYDFSEDCVLMVLADQLYDPTDYIRDYAEFCRLARGER
jgi:dTDP-4-dehydrorhamnose 3,5-epimerase-like enzyme